MKFSLIVPLEPGRNAEILEAIKKLDYPKNQFEVIVEEGRNPSENRNRGIEKSKGDFIVFLDDDAFIKEDYLKMTENFFNENPQVDIVGGPQLSPKKGENFFARLSGAVLTSNFGAFKVNKRYRKASRPYEADQSDLTSANLCAKKQVFEEISGFDTRLYPGEDPEFINRAKKNNLRVFYNPEMIIYHKRRASFSKYILQMFKYGKTRPKLNRISGETKILFLIPMLFLMYFSLIPILSIINNIFYIPLLIYAFLAIIFGIYDSIQSRIISGIILLPFMYLFTHLSYGLGVLSGYIMRD